MPIGNGKLGAMVYGNVEMEQLQMNEDSIWYGRPIDRVNPDSYASLEQIRSLILQGRPEEAGRLLRYAFTGTPNSQRLYQPLADCTICMRQGDEICDYQMELDLAEAVVRMSYRTSRGKISREYFASAVQGIIAVRLEASEGEKISFDLLLTREHFYDEVKLEQSDEIYLTGNLGKGGLDFAAGCKVTVLGGMVHRIGEYLVVDEADSAVIYLTGSSSFYEKELLPALEKRLRAAAGITYEELKEVHTADYQSLFGRMRLVLPEQEECEGMPIPKRLERVRQGASDTGLLSLYFDFGRYLLISSSRPGSLPATLQGIWNHRMMPPWESKYTININLQMNYWPAESCNLAPCMEPVFDLLLRLWESGRKTAKKMYGCRGFVAHHNTDIWADTVPQDIYLPATYWPMGGAWLSLFLWKHYTYSLDLDWLKHYFPILEDSVLFFLDFLVEDKGEYVTCPSLSPENTYIMENGIHACVCAGPAMDSEILRDLFTAYLQAEALLDGNGKWKIQVLEHLHKLPPIKVGKYGQIMEWREDYEEAEPGHRHISQLYALYPSGQITLEETSDLAKAAAATLKRRMQHGGGHTGWSCAWIANFYAQLGMAQEAEEMLYQLLRQSAFDNLMDNHPHAGGAVFQMDGNMGGCDAMIQMLLQEHENSIFLLPACPEDWKEGALTGVRLKGNAELSLTWTRTEVSAVIRAREEWYKTVVCGKERRETALREGECGIFMFVYG